MDHDDFAVEPIPGLPDTPPKGEVILWQGRPDVLPLARQSMALDWVIGYFAVLAVLRVVASTGAMGLTGALPLAIPFLALGALVAGLILLIAWVQAKATVYTITTERVAMRIGAALTLTLNLPFTQIVNAELDLRRRGTGTVAMELSGKTRLSYLVCWPHVRPWRMSKTQPALRCIPDAARVAALLADAAEARVSTPTLASTPISAAAVAAE